MKKITFTQTDYIRAHKKASREEEIKAHNHPILLKRVHQSKKVYNRKKSKADSKGLPYFFVRLSHFDSRVAYEN